MISTLLMYTCLQFDANGCASEEVWRHRQWEGPGAPMRCESVALEANRQAQATGRPYRFECEHSSGEVEPLEEPSCTGDKLCAGLNPEQ